MRENAKKIIACASAFLMLVFALGVVCALSSEDASYTDDFSYDLTSSEEGGRLSLADDKGKSDYKIIFSSDTMTFDYDLSNDIRKLISKSGITGVSIKSDSVETSVSAHEILIGNTDREESKELLSYLEELCDDEDDLAWGYAVIGEKLLFAANSQMAFKIGQEEFLAYFEENINSLPLDLFVTVVKDVDDYADEIRQEKIDTLLSVNGEFTDAQFNTDKYTPGTFYKPMCGEGGHYPLGAPSGEPWYYPTQGDHPRYFVTKNNLDRIREILSEGEDKTSIYFDLSKEFWLRADTDIESIDFGVFPSVRGESGQMYRYDGEMLGVIEAKALAYLVTGDEIYAYEAIIGIKNAILSLKYTTDLHVDVYHGPSHVMITVAAVYDWCYDVLTETDKWHLIWGTAQILGPQLERTLQYPPIGSSGMNAISGHGTGPQFLRDWVSVASVFYDEVPDWWRFVGGRFFNEYLPAANYQYENGWVSQGTASYAPIKVNVQAWALYLIYLSTGEMCITEDFSHAAYFLMSHVLPSDYSSYRQFYFQTGDGSRNTYGQYVGFNEYLLLAAMYNDPVAYAHALTVSKNHSRFQYDTTFTMTPSLQLALASAIDYNGERVQDHVDSIQYFADPAGQMTIRQEWGNPNAVTVLMRVMNRTLGNHEGQDHGSFQIYYKGLLAATSGAYKKYGSPAHYYYHQSTVAHNGLLVFNPAYADAEPIYDDSNENAKTNIANAERYYYSGSQIRTNPNQGSADEWLETSRRADTLGASYGYDSSGAAKYAYLAGDISAAYHEDTVEYVGRRMLTIFTGDEDFPAIFLTYDQITSRDESFRKSWLLHVHKEPEVDIDELSATVVNGDGKMYVKSLFGAEAIVKIGGSGRAWWINGYFADPSNKGSWDERTQSFTDPENVGSWIEGKNAQDDFATDDNADKIWGRIELRADGEKSNNFLTLMAITDAENTAELEYEKFSSDKVHGVQVGKNIAAFTNTAENYHKEIFFNTSGRGLFEYYVAGLASGTWQISVDGVSVAYSYADAGESMITFMAPAGNVRLIPSADVIGDTGGKIQYNSGGAKLPSDTPYTYTSESVTPLPTDVIRGGDVFVGWYTSPNFEPETKITEIPMGMKGTIKLYAKWLLCFMDEDYSTTDFNLAEGENALVNGINYASNKNKGAYFKTVEENGTRYLLWITGEKDPILNVQDAKTNISIMNDTSISYTLVMGKDGDFKVPDFDFSVIGKKTASGENASGNSSITLGKIQNEKFYFAKTSTPIADLSSGETVTVRLVIDFEEGVIRAYGEKGREIATSALPAIPDYTGANSYSEWRKCFASYLFYTRRINSSLGNATDSIRYYQIRIEEGNAFEGLLEPPSPNSIFYSTGGGTLPEGAPEVYDPASETVLPIPTLSGYAFGGWYTTPTFDEGTKTTAVPAGHDGFYEVYAKWNIVFVSEDYVNTDVNLGEGENKTINGIAYSGNSKPGAYFKTEEENGVKYLVWYVGSNDPIINVQDSTVNISAMKENTVSYTFTIGKHADRNVPDFDFSLIGKHNVIGGSANSSINLGKIKSGVFYLGDTSIPIADLTTEEIVTLRIVLDFESGVIIAYGEKGKEVAKISMPAIPAATGATSYSEWRKCFRSYIFYTRRTNYPNGTPEDAVRYYQLRIEEGNAFEGLLEPPSPNSIFYSTGGGTLPAGAPEVYDPTSETVLPIPTLSGYAFGGWYTTSTFDEGTKTTAVPAGHDGFYEVYAKWNIVFVSEDYVNTDVNLGEGENKTINGIAYSGNSKPGAYFKTEEENGVKYLVWYVGSNDPVINVQNSTVNISSMKENSVSYTLTIGKHADRNVPDFDFSLVGKHNVIGGSANSSINLGKIKSGVFYLGDTSIPIADLTTEEIVTLRIVLDFESGVIIAYGEKGKEVAKISMPAIPAATGATSYSEWRKCFRSYIFYTRRTNYPNGTPEDAVRYYQLRIEEGNAFEGLLEPPSPNSIFYSTGGGTLPEGAPEVYDPASETVLPIPTLSGYAFGGWYTTPTFDEGTKTAAVPAGHDGFYEVYAKWNVIFVNEDYTKTEVEVFETDKTVNGVTYCGNNRPATLFKTETEDGKTYLLWTTGEKDSIMNVQNSTVNIASMTDTSVSYTLTIGKHSGEVLPDFEFNLVGKHTVTGESCTAFTINIGKILDGTFYLGTSKSVPVASLASGEPITIRIVLDFADGLVKAYGADGEIIASIEMPAIPAATGATSYSEWKKCFRSYLFYTRRLGYTNGSPTDAIRYYQLRIEEGNVFETLA